MGIYDTVYITTGEQEQIIEPDSWLRQDRSWPIGVNRDEKAFFRYEVDNRQFGTYTADIEVSLWRSQEKVRDLMSQSISAAGFEKVQIEWVVDTAEIIPVDLPPEQSFQYTVVIKRGRIERRIIVPVNPLTYPLKPVPAR